MKSKVSSWLAVLLMASELIALFQKPADADRYIKRCYRDRHGRQICHSERVRSSPSTHVNIHL